MLLIRIILINKDNVDILVNLSAVMLLCLIWLLRKKCMDEI